MEPIHYLKKSIFSTPYIRIAVVLLVFYLILIMNTHKLFVPRTIIIPMPINVLEDSENLDFPTDHHATKTYENNVGASNKSHEDQDREKIGCNIRELNPFDPSIMEYYNKGYGEVNCTSNPKFPLLFTTDLNTTLIRVNDPQKYGYHSCCYSSFVRDGKDTKINISTECHPILEEETIIPLDIKFILIKCANSNSSNNASTTTTVVDLFPFIRLNSSEDAFDETHTTPESTIGETTEALKSTRKKVNVAIFGIDGVSHMNFIRTMPKAYSYLTQNLSALGLWGYTKVGDNTFPNMVPALTGFTVEEIKKPGQCWENTSLPYDNCPFIWKDFSRQGYATAYGEDSVDVGIFNFGKPGFSQEPTDSYIHAMTQHQSEFTGHIGNNFCYGPRLSFQVLLNYLKQMALAATSRTLNPDNLPYFQFIWATTLTHLYLNDGLMGDEHLLGTLEWLQSGSYLEDTVLILMSDHGTRYGYILETIQGIAEGRMPFLYFVFPPWFYEQYPSAIRNLKENKHRLTSPFDLHETLKDLVNIDQILPSNIQVRENILHFDKAAGAGPPRGVSLFLPIPKERTCEDAGISLEFCTCGSYKAMLQIENNPFVKEGAQDIVTTINHMLGSFEQCWEMVLTKVTNALVLDLGGDLGSDDGNVSALDIISLTNSSDPRLAQQNLTLSISLIVGPSNASFEATTTRLTDGKWVVSGDISRTNMYGNQSYCVSDYNLKKYCYCR